MKLSLVDKMDIQLLPLMKMGNKEQYHREKDSAVFWRYLEAIKAAPKAAKEFIDGILERFKKQEKSIEYEPIPAPKVHTQERGKRSKNKDYER